MYFMMALLRKKLLQIDTLQYQNYEISFTKIKPFKVFTDWLINYPCVWYTKLYFEVTFTSSSMKCLKARRVHANKILYIFPLIPWRYLFWRRKVMRTIHTIYSTAKIYKDIYFHDFLNLTWLDTWTKEMGFFVMLQRNRTRRKPFRGIKGDLMILFRVSMDKLSPLPFSLLHSSNNHTTASSYK